MDRVTILKYWIAKTLFFGGLAVFVCSTILMIWTCGTFDISWPLRVVWTSGVLAIVGVWMEPYDSQVAAAKENLRYRREMHVNRRPEPDPRFYPYIQQMGGRAMLNERKWNAHFELKWQDLWIGAFWKRTGGSIDLWVCLIPCLPLHVSWWSQKDPEERS